MTEGQKRPLEFKVRGRVVAPKTIERHMKENNIHPREPYTPSPSMREFFAVPKKN
jgi:hypothetical protein